MSDNHHPRPFSRRNDERLVMFLQEHRPSAPPAPLNSEEQLLLLLDRPLVSEGAAGTIPSATNRLPARPRWRLWAIPSAIAIGSMLAWGGYRARAPQIAEQRATELEEFLVRSWDGLVPTPAATLRTYEAEWLLQGPVAADASAFSAQAEPASYP